MEVLEFGCGTGTTALAHAAYVRHILAIDIADRMIEIARQNASLLFFDHLVFPIFFQK